LGKKEWINDLSRISKPKGSTAKPLNRLYPNWSRKEERDGGGERKNTRKREIITRPSRMRDTKKGQRVTKRAIRTC